MPHTKFEQNGEHLSKAHGFHTAHPRTNRAPPEAPRSPRSPPQNFLRRGPVPSSSKFRLRLGNLLLRRLRVDRLRNGFRLRHGDGDAHGPLGPNPEDAMVRSKD